jgi:protein-S-isoprenylcysteine O-methyltransferase Ste14
MLVVVGLIVLVAGLVLVLVAVLGSQRQVDGRPAAAHVIGSSMTVRNVVLALLGAAILVLKPAYDGPGEVAVHSYAGNVAVSFALYFAAINATERLRHPRLVAALAVLVAVEAFEVSDGFGVMANVFDPVDLFANAVGIALAATVDVLTARGHIRRPEPTLNDRKAP